MKRIEEIAEMVRKGMVTADIGTDHAFLPIWLIRNGICPKVYACDITEGPLSAARRNIAKEKMEDRIIPVLSDGLDHVPDDVSCIVIAGMGGRTAVGILERGMARLPDLKQIIVEANSETELLRRWISEHGFTIRSERMIRDRNHDYAAVCFDCTPHTAYSDKEIILGPVLMAERSPAFSAYCRRMAEKLEMILSHRHDEELVRRKKWYMEYASEK